MKLCFSLTVAVFFVPASVQAQLELWSGTPTNVSITGATAQILAPGTYKFQSLDVNDDPTGIDLIFINSSVSGTVTVHIARNPADLDGDIGATTIGELRLDATNATYTGNLAELRISGELGVNQLTSVRSISGTIDFGTTSRAIDVGFNFSADMTATTIGDINISTFFLQGASITASTLGNVTVANDFNGEITVNGNHAGNITALDVVGNPAIITINGDYSGVIDVAEDFAGHITITNDLVTPGRIELDEDLTANINMPTAAVLA